MRKKTLFIVLSGLFILLISSLLVSKLTFAQVPTGTADNNAALMQQGKVKTCLKAAWVKDPAAGITSQVTQVRLTGTCGSPSGCTCVFYHGANDAGSNFGEGQECAKGNVTAKHQKYCNHQRSDARNEVLSGLKAAEVPCTIVKNNLAGKNKNLARDTTENSQVLGDSSTSVIDPGQVDVIASETTYRHTSNQFYAVGDLAADTTATGNGGTDAITGDLGGQQQAQIEFISQQLNTTVDNLQTSCTTISWDPYGRVFDAVSLEPIQDVLITLIDSLTGKPAVQQVNFNDDVTGADGVFNIQVEKEGGYQLTVDAGPDDLFIAKPSLNANWSKVYSDLYLPGATFIEKTNVATHHDIALQPKGTPYHDAVAVMIPATLKSESFTNAIVYNGRETFPYAKICLVDSVTGKTVGSCVNANNVGLFTLAVDKKSLPQGSTYLQATKVDLTNPATYKSKQTTAVDTLHVNSTASDTPATTYFQPILSYVEGYAKDETGQVIPGANVTIKLTMNDEIAYQTKADDSGYFTIYTNNLPSFEYYFVFSDAPTQKEITKTTSQFVIDNKAYLDSKKLNLMTATENDQPIINPATGKLNDIVQTKTPINPTINPDNIPATNGNFMNTNIIVIVFILVVLIVTVISVIIFIKKREQLTNEN